MTPCEVIIPVRNAPDVLWLTLTTFWANAQYSGTQAVTLLDNRSTAPGTDLVLAEAHRRGCQVVRHERNLGVWASVNRGLALARAPRVFVLTADVLLAPATIQVLNMVLDDAPRDFVHLGPRVIGGEGTNAFRQTPMLTGLPTAATIDTSTYNGAAWLMRWDVLRERVGWFDPDYYVCAGDTDYSERIRRAGLLHGVVQELPCVHLDKQTRRREGDAAQDTDVEIRDLSRFHAQWQHAPDVLARHPLPDRARYLAGKHGWQAGTL